MDVCQHYEKSILLNELKRQFQKKYVGDDYFYSRLYDKIIVLKKTKTSVILYDTPVKNFDFCWYVATDLIVIAVYECKNLVEIVNHYSKNTVFSQIYCYKTIEPPFYQATDFMDGENKMWYDNGSIRYIYVKDNGVRVGVFKGFYKSGQIGKISNWIKGQMNGQYESFYENGNLLRKTTYLNGYLNGLCEDFYPNGNIRERSNWRNGLLVELVETFFDDGNTIVRSTYYKNVVV